MKPTFLKNALYFSKEECLVVSDLHLGISEIVSGVSLQEEMFSSFGVLLRSLDPKLVVINGDVKHSFGEITDKEWRDIKRFFDLILPRKLIVVQGNHDAILEPICRDRGIRLVESFLLGEILFCHGHKDVSFGISKKIVIGHGHPAIGLRKGNREEKYKCFLVGEYANRELIMCPSFSNWSLGTDVLSASMVDIFGTKLDVKNFNVFISGDEVYHFGKVKDID